VRISVDDGCESDTRIAELCAKYEVPCVFYWPVEWVSLANKNGYKPLTYAQALDIANNFEVGSHSVTHRLLTRISEEEAFVEIVDSKHMLSNLFNQEITKFAPPRGYTNHSLTLLAHEHYNEQRLTKQDGLLHIHPDSGVNNNVNWKKLADENEYEELFCHSWELDKYNEWENLERYLDERLHS